MVLSFIGDLIGGHQKAKSQKAANKITAQNNAWQQQFALNQFNTQQSNRRQDIALQKQFAKEGTGWQFDDLMESADEAGIHRLAALGAAGGQSYQPVQTSGVGVPGLESPQPVGDEFIGDAIGNAIRNYQNSQQTKQQNRLVDAQIQTLNAEANAMNAATSRTQIAQNRRTTTTAPQNEGPRFPTVNGLDLGSQNATDHRIPIGGAINGNKSLEGKYVISYEGYYYATGWNTPVGTVADIMGEIAGEGSAALSTENWRTLIGESRRIVPVDDNQWAYADGRDERETYDPMRVNLRKANENRGR